MIMSAAATHTPEQIQFYCLDFGGGTLPAWPMFRMSVESPAGWMPTAFDAPSPRCPGCCASESSGSAISASNRCATSASARLSLQRCRQMSPREIRLSQDKFGDVVLVVDGWATIKADFEHLEPVLQALAIQGLSYGIHLAISATRWMEIRPAVKDMLGTRIELRMGDPIDSEVGRKFAELVPIGRPGPRHHR